MGQTPDVGPAQLRDAIRAGDRVEVRRVLEAGVDPNKTDQGGWAPLLWAAVGKQVDIVRDLLQAGASPNCATPEGDATPLMYAAHLRSAPMVQMLLEAGAQIDAADNRGWTALAWCDDKRCEAILRQFGGKRLTIEVSAHERNRRQAELDRKAAARRESAAARLRDLRTDDHLAVTLGLEEAREHDLPEEALRLIRAGADVNYREDDEVPTVLMWAAYKGYLDVLQAAVQAGAELEAGAISSEVENAGTALALAAAAGQAESVRLLAEAGADLDRLEGTSADGFPATALMIAAERGNLGTVRALLEKGADPRVRNHAKRRASDFAHAGGHSQIVELLEDPTAGG